MNLKKEAIIWLDQPSGKTFSHTFHLRDKASWEEVRPSGVTNDDRHLSGCIGLSLMKQVDDPII